MQHESRMSNRRASVRKAGMAEYNAKRLQIVGIAADIFKERGFQATNINEIASAAGIDRATFYYYAASKKELFQEVVGEAVKDNVLMIEQIADGEGSAVEKMQNFVGGLLSWFHQHYPYLFVYIQEDMTKIGSEDTKWAKEMRRLERRFDDAVTRIIQQGVDSKTFEITGDARLVAFGIIGMLNWSHRWYRPASGYTVEQITASFSEMIMNGLCAKSSPRSGQHRR